MPLFQIFHEGVRGRQVKPKCLAAFSWAWRWLALKATSTCGSLSDDLLCRRQWTLSEGELEDNPAQRRHIIRPQTRGYVLQDTIRFCGEFRSDRAISTHLAHRGDGVRRCAFNRIYVGHNLWMICKPHCTLRRYESSLLTWPP